MSAFWLGEVLFWLSRALSLVLWEEDGDGGEGKSESVKLICESEVSIILAFRVRISRICPMPLGRPGPFSLLSWL